MKNSADLTSDPYALTPTFVISGNPVATDPVITSASVYKVPSYGANPLTQGTNITGTCLTAANLPDPLIIAIVLNVTSSNAPISWLDRAFEGPTNNLEGGGSSATAVDLSNGNWRVVRYNSIASPNFAPKGLYYYHNLDVKNEGNKTSNKYGGTSLGFTLGEACP